MKRLRDFTVASKDTPLESLAEALASLGRGALGETEDLRLLRRLLEEESWGSPEVGGEWRCFLVRQGPPTRSYAPIQKLGIEEEISFVLASS